MLLAHNPYSFISGDDPFIASVPIHAEPHMVVEELVFQMKHEGFIGIPHGGMAMGVCLDAWRRIGTPTYPVHARFKFGGSGVGIGERTMFEVETASDKNDSTVKARITKPGDKTPYLRADISPANGSLQAGPGVEPPREPIRDLPYYRNCFVCGHHRSDPGLQRRFRVHGPDLSNVTSTSWGETSEDKERARLFRIDREELHPAVLVSIFDENTAWAGFMQTRSCGLSVRLELTMLRPVGSGEQLLFVGKPAGIRGNPKAPRFFLAEGAIMAVSDHKGPEPVAYGRGEWVILDQYTRQIKANMLPEDDWQWLFGED